MTKLSLDLSAPAAPGIVPGDVLARALGVVRATVSELRAAFQAARHEVALREGLSGLDRRRLRDLGIDRSRA